MKYKDWIRIVIFSIIWLILYNSFLIKLPFYLYMNNITLPEGCEQLETKVTITDVEIWHIIAERLVYSEKREEEIASYIHKHNIFSKKIEVYDLYEANGRDYNEDIFISDEKYPYQEQDAENYILLHYSTWGGHLYEIMEWIGIIIMLIICILIYKVSAN